MGIDPEELGGTLVIEGAIPPESGFGSSGALCAALARSLAARQAELGHPVHEDMVWTAANEAERLFHGSPSGVDTGVSLKGGLLMVEPGGSFPPAAHSLPRAGVHVVYGSVPRDSSCAANVAAIGKAMRLGDTRVSGLIGELGAIAARAGTLLAASLSDPAMLGVLASEAMGLLSRLGLSTPALDALVADGMSAGALGGKLSGGGGGGAFWLACPDADTAAAVQESVVSGARRLRLPGDAWVGRIVI
jgi:mevalonate kinase